MKEIKPSSRLVDITGQRFGRLVALSLHEFRDRWVCICDCGTVKVVFSTHLKRGKTKSCGCLSSEMKRMRNAANAKHGMWKSDEFRIWQGMIQRCSTSNKDEEKRRWYADRGIAVCDRWLNSFTDFLRDVGPRPSKLHSIDRINNDAGYEPGNVRWALHVEQCNNKSNNVFIDAGGELLTIAQFARKFGLSASGVGSRLARGVSWPELALPARNRRSAR